MANNPKNRKITFLDPMSEEFSAAMMDAFREGVEEVVQAPGDHPVARPRAVRRVRYAKKKKKARR